MSSSPSDHNLLELYRQHRDEIDALTTPDTLFLLAFANHLGSVRVDTLASDLGLSLGVLRAKLTPLLRGQLIAEDRRTLMVTALGKRVLAEIGLLAPPLAPSQLPKEPEPPRQPPTAGAKPAGTPGWLWSMIAFLGTGAVALLVILVAGIVFLPEILPPRVPTITPQIATSIPLITATGTPTPSPSPSSTPTSTLTPTASATSWVTPTASATPTLTPTSSATPTPTPSRTATPSPSPSPSPTSPVLTIPAGHSPAVIVFHPTGKTVYVGSPDGTIIALDSQTRKIATEIRGLPPVSWLAISPKGDRLFATMTNGIVLAFDTNNLNNIVAKGSVDVQTGPDKPMVITNDGRYLLVSDSYARSSNVFALETDKLSQTSLLTSGLGPRLPEINRASSLVFVPCFADNLVAVYGATSAYSIRPTSRSSYVTIPVEGGPVSAHLSKDESLLYVSLGNEPQIAIVNVKALKVEQLVQVPSSVLAAALSPDGQQLVAISNKGNFIFVFDTGARRVSAAYAVGKAPRGIAISPDNRTIWVANSGDGTLSVIALP